MNRKEKQDLSNEIRREIYEDYHKCTPKPKDDESYSQLVRSSIGLYQNKWKVGTGYMITYADLRRIVEGSYELTLTVKDLASGIFLPNISIALNFNDIDNKPEADGVELDDLVKYLHDGLAGWFKFDENDEDELDKITQKVAFLMADRDDENVGWFVNNVYYETVDNTRVLRVCLTKSDVAKMAPEDIDLWIDYSDLSINENRCKDTCETNPYSKEAILSLSLKQFIELIEVVSRVKEEIINEIQSR